MAHSSRHWRRHWSWPPPRLTPAPSSCPLLPPRPTRKHLLHRQRPKTETENPKSVRQVFPRRRLSLQKCLIKATSETQPQNGNKNYKKKKEAEERVENWKREEKQKQKKTKTKIQSRIWATERSLNKFECLQLSVVFMELRCATPPCLPPHAYTCSLVHLDY